MKKKHILLVAILFLALAARLYRIEINPYGFFCDEAAIGYNAYRILTTGKDEYGESFPIFFRSFGDYKNPVPVYSAIPLIAILGLNEFSVRLVSGIYGIAGVFAIYLMTREIFFSWKEREEISLFSAFLLAISPWHIQFSRIGTEYISFVFWATFATWLWIRGLRNRGWFTVLGAVAMSLAFYTYHPAKVFVPAMLLFSTMIFYRRQNIGNHKALGIAGIVIAICLLPFIMGLTNGESLARLGQLSANSDMGMTERLQRIATAYFNYFSPVFLFTKGDIGFPEQNVTRHGVRGMGELYLFQIPLVLLGLVWMIRNADKKESQICWAWLLVYPAAAALTIDMNPLATRGIIGSVIWQIISALGLYVTADLLHFKFTKAKGVVYSIGIVVGIISFGSYWRLWLEYPLYSSDYWGWQSGPEEMIDYYLNNTSEYDSFYLDPMFNSPHIFLDFYLVDTGLRSTTDVKEPFDVPLKQRQLWGVRKDVFEKTEDSGIWTIESVVYYPNREPAFYLLEPREQATIEREL